MGKQKKEKALKGNRSNPLSRNSLGDQMVSDRYVDPLDQKVRKKSKSADEIEDPEFVDEKMTNKILNQARMQQMHLENDLAEEEDPKFKKEPKSKSAIRSKKSYLGTNSDESDDDELQQLSDEDDGSCSEFYNDIKIDPEEEKALEMFMNKDAGPSKRLGDLVMEKYTEKLTELDTVYSEAGFNAPKLDPRVHAMYEGVKDILAKYRSGKLPKAFKLIPRLSNWEQVLYITDPNGWTAATMYQATRIFASNLKEKMAQRFFNLVLLPRIRDDISQYKKLNFHLYQALRKALFKPGAFMKGIIIPLCESGDCTLREAIIVGSVVGKNSIPLLHSSAAMLKIAEMEYNGANSIFLKTFVDKKYALPYRVIDAMVYHFLKFERDKRVLPVLWHQSFLSFVQRYKDYLSSEQKEALQGLLRVQLHQQITPEIRRELMNSKCRDDVAAESEINKSEGVDDDNMN